MKNKMSPVKLLVMVVFSVILITLTKIPTTLAASLSLTVKYSQTGGINGPLNSVGDLINGIPVCPVNPTDGCDFSSDPGYNNNGTVEDPSDDFYEGDLLVRTNDDFEIIAAWSWSGDADGTQKDVTLIGALPPSGEFRWDGLPGFCDPSGSSISADGLTVTCLRSDIDHDNVGTKAEDAPFPVRVKGSATNGIQPGDITFSITSSDGALEKTDNAGASLTVTASPRWNLQKGLYGYYSGRHFDDDGDPNTPDVNGYILDYQFFIETDEVDGETDNAPALLGNESMGESATFNFTDEIDEIAPHAQLVGCSMKGRYEIQDGYEGSANPVSYAGPGSIKEGVENIHIPQLADEQQITCTQNGTSINVQVSGVDATLNNYPTKSYNEQDLPVNRAIVAIGNIYIFVPLSDVENGADGQPDTADDGSLQTKNKLRNFDPTSPSGKSNFGNNTESEKDNDRLLTLYGMRGSFSKYYRGEESSVWNYPGGATGARSGDGIVNAGYEFSTVLVNNNTGGTSYTERMCDVVDAYRLEIQKINDNTMYNTIKTAYSDGYHNNDTPIMYRIWNGSGQYDNGLAQEPYEFEYSSRYVDNSWLPSRGGNLDESKKTYVEAECNQTDGWFSTIEEAKNDPQGIGAITKIRVKLRDGVTHPPAAYSYIWINHKVRSNDLLTGQPLQNGDEIGNWTAYSFNEDDFSGPSYLMHDYPVSPEHWNGDRVIFSGAKVRIQKTSDKSSVSPGDEINFTLNWSYTNDTATHGSGNVKIFDVLPSGVSYQEGTTNGANEPSIGSCADIDQSITCDDNENQVLIWDMGNVEINGNHDPITFTSLIKSTASAGTATNTVYIESPTDASAITQRKAEVGFNIAIPSSLLINKDTVQTTPLEHSDDWVDIDYTIDLRNGKPGTLTNLDIIDILPFVGDGQNGAIKFNDITTQRQPGTDFYGAQEFVSMNLVPHPERPNGCDVSANGGVKYYYTTVDPTIINLAPSVGEENVIGGAQSIWSEGTNNSPPNGMSVNDITAVRAIGPTMSADAICQFQLKLHVNNNLAGDIYNNSAGVAANGVTLPVMSNSKATTVVGSSISNLVWIDTNANGIQDPGENGLAGVQVKLLDGNGNPVNNPETGQPYVVQTNANGEYLFEKLNHGIYQVRFTAPEGYFYSEGHQGSDDSDSDVTTVDGQLGTTDQISLGFNEDKNTVDAGLYEPASLGDFIWNDINANGIQDPGENGLADVTLRLLDTEGHPIDNPNNPGEPYEVTTNNNGEYSFDNLRPGQYLVEMVKPDGYLVSPSQVTDNTADSDFDSDSNRTSSVTLISGENNHNLDGGLYQTASLSGKVWRDDERDGIQADWEPKMEGVTVELLDSNGDPVDNPNNPGTPYTVSTGADGSYRFENLIPGDYQIRFTPPTNYNPSDKNQGNDDSRDSDIDTNTLTSDVVSLQSGENRTNLDAGFYSLYANVFDPPSAIKTVSESGEHEVEWKMVWINNGNMAAINTQVLDDIPNGTTYVANSVFCEARGASVTNVCTYDSAENRIRWEGDIAPDPGGTNENDSLNEVVITYRTSVPPEMETVQNQASAHWDANGDGSFQDDLNNGQDAVLSDDSDINGNDPTVWHQRQRETGEGSIGNTIWFDSNANGRQDEGEPGLKNIRVKLIWYGPNGKYDHGKKDDVVWRTDTNHNGHYKFEDLPEGKYKIIVKEEDVANYIQTYDPDHKMDGRDTVHLGKKQDYTKGDFGYSNQEWKLAKTGESGWYWLLGIIMMFLLPGLFTIKEVGRV